MTTEVMAAIASLKDDVGENFADITALEARVKALEKARSDADRIKVADLKAIEDLTERVGKLEYSNQMFQWFLNKLCDITYDCEQDISQGYPERTKRN